MTYKLRLPANFVFLTIPQVVFRHFSMFDNFVLPSSHSEGKMKQMQQKNFKVVNIRKKQT